MYSLRKSILNATVASSLILILNPALPISHVYVQEKKAPYKRPAVTEIETRLFELVNKARIKQALPHLRLSQELCSLARKHSKDMASPEELSHLSTSGKRINMFYAAGWGGQFMFFLFIIFNEAAQRVKICIVRIYQLQFY